MIAPALLVIAFFLPSLSAEEPLLARPFIIGASLSDGFHLPELGLPFFSPKSKALGMHFALAKADGDDGKMIPNLGTNWMFAATDANGRYQVKKARATKPSVVLAVDYLFWYLYGNSRGRSPADRALTRLEYFEKGLKNLATLDSPVVVGNIPDAQDSVGIVLAPSQYPGSETIAVANLRLDQWLATHPNMIKVDLAKFHDLANRNEEIAVNGKVFPAGTTQEGFLQRDRLHPTPGGITAIVGVVLEALQKSRP